MKFVAVRQVGLMTPRECRIEHPFPYQVTGVGWEPGPPAGIGTGSPISTDFLALNPQYLKTLSYGLVIGSTGSHSSSSSPTSINSLLQHYPEIALVALSYQCYFLWLAVYALVQLGLELLSSSLSLSRHSVREALLFGPLTPLAALTAISLE